MGRTQKALKQADPQPLATHGNRFGAHGKEGVDGSSPSEGSAKAPLVGAFVFRSTRSSSIVRWVWSTEADTDSFRRTYETNVFGVVAVTNAFLPVLRRSAHPRIVNVSSGTGSLEWSSAPNPQFNHETAGSAAAYRSSKTALNALTVYYAQALAAEGFKVNALAPGLRATDLNARAAASGGDPAEAAAGAVRLALLPDDGPSGQFFSWDGTAAPW